MSLKAFLAKIWAEVKHLFDNMPSELRIAAQIAVTIVENLKTVVDNPTVDVFTALIPGNLDEHIVACLRSSLPLIITDLRLAENSNTTPDSKALLISGVKNIQSLTGDVRHAFLHDIGILLAQDIAKAKNNDLRWTDAVYFIEWYYQQKFKKS